MVQQMLLYLTEMSGWRGRKGLGPMSREHPNVFSITGSPRRVTMAMEP